MTQLVLLFAGFGLSYVVGFSTISQWPRRLIYGPPWKEGDPVSPRQKFVEWLECPACFGMWAGMGLGIYSDALVQGPLLFRALATGFAVAGFNYAAARLVKLIPAFAEVANPAGDAIANAMNKYSEVLGKVLPSAPPTETQPTIISSQPPGHQ